MRSTLSGANVSIRAVNPNGGRGDLTLAGTTIDTPGTLTLEADRLVMAAQTTQVDQSHTSQGRDLMWQRTLGEGSSTPTVDLVRIQAGQVVQHVSSVQVETGAQQSIDALARQPGMAWVDQLRNDPALAGKVDWAKVDDAYRTWDYRQQGLTPEGAAIVTLVAACFTAGAASSWGAAAGTAAGGGTTGAIVGGAVTAGLTTLAGQVAVAVVNHQGNLGAALREIGSSQNVHALLTAIVTGGALGALNLNPTGQPTVGGGAQGLMDQLGRNLQAAAARAVIGTAINGGSLADGLRSGIKSALIDTLAAQAANQIGDWTRDGTLDDIANKIAHAVAGCAVGAAKADHASGCAPGALGAAVGELAAEVHGRDIDTVQFASMMGGIAMALAGGDAAAIHAASATAANAAANNYLNHPDAASLRRLVDACKTQCTPSQREQLADLIAQDSTTTAAFNACASRQETACQAIRADYAAAAASFLPTDNDIWSWARTQATASNGTYTAAQIYDAYVLNVPTTVVLGTGLCVDEDRKQTETSTGASVGAVGLPSGVATTTAGSTYRYTRGDGTATSNRISFVFNGTNHIDLNFGEVKDSTFAASLALSGLPLSTLSYPHVFTAGTKGTVVFSITSSAATPAMTGWSEKIFFDALCEGRVLPGAQQLYPGAAGTSLTVTAGDKICIVVQQFIPSNASIGSKNLIVVEARFDYAGANPTLTSSYMLNDNSSVGDAALELVKEVRNVTQSSVKFEHTNQAKSGDVLEYRLSYANNAAVPIRNLVINDSVPSYSAFISAAQDVTPSTLTGCMKSTPANPLPAAEVDCAVTQTVGGKGPLQWRFVGALNPADRGSVLFRVKVD